MIATLLILTLIVVIIFGILISGKLSQIISNSYSLVQADPALIEAVSNVDYSVSQLKDNLVSIEIELHDIQMLLKDVREDNDSKSEQIIEKIDGLSAIEFELGEIGKQISALEVYLPR